MSKRICVIIPCFNEAERLAANREAFLSTTCDLVFVDDGSTDGTAEWVRSLGQPHIHLLQLPSNAGKAEAVRQGILFSQTLPGARDMEWVGYWDADLSTPLSEADYFLRFATLHSEREPAAVLGSRVSRLGSQIERSAVRHLLGRCFATVVKCLLPQINSYDSQCGAKLFRREWLDPVFGKPFLSRWIFDVEIILRLRDAEVLECPVRQWKEIPGGRFRIHRHAWGVLKDLLRITAQYR